MTLAAYETEICLGDKRQTRRQNMAKIVFWRGVSEIELFIFPQNNINLYAIYNNYVKLGMVFHAIIIIFGK